MEKNKKINFSIVISLISLVISFLTSFLFTKFLIKQPQIGAENYGLKTTVDSIVSFVSIFTFGMSSTFIRFQKKYPTKSNDVTSSFNIIFSIVSLFALLFGIVVIILTMNGLILKVGENGYTEDQLHQFTLILIISVCYIALSIILGVNKWFLESTKHIVIVRLVNLIVLILYPLISIIFVLNGCDMVVVTLVYSLCYLSGFIFYLVYRIIKTKDNNFTYKYATKPMVKEILIFSIFVIITVCVETLNFSVDKLILTLTLNAASLSTVYQLSVTLNQVLLSLSDTIYSPYLPFLAEDIENKNTEEVEKTYNRVSFLLLLISFLLLVGFVCCGKEFVNIWVGEEIGVDNSQIVYYFTIITFSTWPLYGVAKFSTLLHRFSNKHKESALVYGISFIIHLIFTFSLLKVLGMWACIIGTFASMLFVGISYIFLNKKMILIRQKELLVSFIKFLVICLISILPTLLLGHFVLDKINNVFLIFFTKGAISVILFVLGMVLLFHKEFKLLIVSVINKIKGRHNEI